jgi:hypothetical protein
MFNLMMPQSRASGGLWTAYIYLHILIAAVLSRFVAAVWYIVPGLRTLPDNWVKEVFETNVFEPARFVPGGDTVTHRLMLYTTASRRDFVRSFSRQIVAVAIVPVALLILSEIKVDWLWAVARLAALPLFMFLFGHSVGLLCQVVAISFRVSVKASAPIWLPLVFAVTGGGEKSIRDTLLDRRVSPFFLLGILLSVVGVTIGAIKLVLLPTLIGVATSHAELAIPEFFTREARAWELIFFVSSLLSFVLALFIVIPGPRRLETGAWTDEMVSRLYGVGMLVLGFLSIYTSLAITDLFINYVPLLKTISGIVWDFSP